MAETDRPITEEDIHNYVDGHIDPNRREEVERHLLTAADDAQAVTAYRHQNRLLREAFDGILDERVPERMIAAAMTVRPRFTRPAWVAAAGIVLFVAGTGLGWSVKDTGGQAITVAAAPDFKSAPDFKAFAISAHRIYAPEVRHPVEVVAAEEQHLVQWLSKRLGHPVKAPALSPLGFELVGGRLLPAPDGQPAAQFMYQDKTMRRLTLYVRGTTATEQTSFRFVRDDDTAMFYWIDAPFAYAMVGSMERDELQRISTTVYKQLCE